VRIVGVDPGVNGAVAVIDTEAGTLAIVDMPREPGRGGKNAVSPTGVALLFGSLQADYVFVEDVSAMPGQGVTSMFNFGRSLGIVLGAAAAKSSLWLVRPQEWKARTNTPTDKTQARRRASELFPRHHDLFARVKDDGRAEAALLAFYGTMKLSATPTSKLHRAEVEITSEA
jgi:crossover junction endodeoxyribonuclease RuvC